MEQTIEGAFVRYKLQCFDGEYLQRSCLYFQSKDKYYQKGSDIFIGLIIKANVFTYYVRKINPMM